MLMCMGCNVSISVYLQAANTFFENMPLPCHEAESRSGGPVCANVHGV